MKCRYANPGIFLEKRNLLTMNYMPENVQRIVSERAVGTKWTAPSRSSCFGHFLFHRAWRYGIILVVELTNVITWQLLPTIGSHMVDWFILNSRDHASPHTNLNKAHIREREQENSTASNTATSPISEGCMVNGSSRQFSSFFHWHVVMIAGNNERGVRRNIWNSK